MSPWLFGRLAIPLLAFAAAATPGLCAGCSNSWSANGLSSSDYDGMLPGAGEDATEGDASEAGPPPAVATVRVAHLSPDLGPIDFCWRTAGSTTFEGPVLYQGPSTSPAETRDAEAGDASNLLDSRDDVSRGSDGGDSGPLGDARTSADALSASDADGDGADAELGDGSPSADAEASLPQDAAVPTAGVSYGEITSSVRLAAAGTFDIALVDAGLGSCVSPKFVGQVTVESGKHATMGIVGLLGAVGNDGEASRALAVVAFVDDEVLDLQNARVRLIHAALGWPGAPAGQAPVPALAASVGSADIAEEIDPLHASSMSGTPPVDALGYSTVLPVAAPQAVSLRGLTDGGFEAWSTQPEDLDLLAGTLHTAFVVSGPADSLAIEWCSDTTPDANAPDANPPPTPCPTFPALALQN